MIVEDELQPPSRTERIRKYIISPYKSVPMTIICVRYFPFIVYSCMFFYILSGAPMPSSPSPVDRIVCTARVSARRAAVCAAFSSSKIRTS